jgi:hypothetical protein
MKLHLLGIAIGFLTALLLTSCANIVPPLGGPRDSLPPVLINATPKDSSLLFSAKRITLVFNEYVTLDNVQQNLIISPNPKFVPFIESKLQTVTIRIKDSLQPHTTYTYNFGNAIKDVNEGNVAKNFTYIFSTGNYLDQNILRGKVYLAETGKVDSTLIVVLHKRLEDSVVKKYSPDYYTRIDRNGNFEFRNLPSDTFAVYVVPNDFSKSYNDSTKLFAFLNDFVFLSDSNHAPVTLYAYQQYKPKPKTSTSVEGSDKKNKGTDRLRIVANLESGKQDLLKPLKLSFDRKVSHIDTNRILLTDTFFHSLPKQIIVDTSYTSLSILYNWTEQTPFKLIIPKGAIEDSAHVSLLKDDTLSFITFREADYGSIHLRFNDIDLSKHPVLQLVQNNTVIDSIPLQQKDWYAKMYRPGEYELRILYDENNDGTWTPGNFSIKKQPEIVIALSRTLNVRANWDNEAEINIQERPPLPLRRKAP